MVVAFTLFFHWFRCQLCLSDIQYPGSATKSESSLFLGIQKGSSSCNLCKNLFLRGTVEIFPDSRKQKKVKNSIKYVQTNHWIAKGNCFLENYVKEIALKQVSAIAKSIKFVFIGNFLNIITQKSQFAQIKDGNVNT